MAACLTCCYECGCYGCAGKTENALFGKSKYKCLNFICSPIALAVHSIYAYVFVCIGVYISRLLNHVICFPCIYKGACNSCYLYKDKRFPATNESLGKPDCRIEWMRATEIIDKPVLFKDSVDPSDVLQGDLGNCWLMSAFASLAEFPGLADKVFINREKSTRGKYKVRLYDGFCERWRVVTVDDMFPVEETFEEGQTKVATKPKPEEPAAKPEEDKGTEIAAPEPAKEGNEEEGAKEIVDSEPKKEIKQAADDIEAARPKSTYKFKYAKSANNEIWVPVLEKAFAKLRGSYANLEGGNTLWAFHALTGDNCFRLKKCEEEERKGIWQKLVLTNDKKLDDTSPIAVRVTKECILEKRMFGLLRAYDRSKALLGASMKTVKDEEGKTVEEKDEETGLVRGHAYSMLQAKTVGSKESFDLIQLRNPWGSLEWNGDWSDNSPKWEEHPDIAEALDFKKDDNDGTFWMCYDDFLRLFDNIDICDRTVNYNNFTLDVHENPNSCMQHSFGPTKGCFEGCFDFWCLCKGIKYIYCGNESTTYMKKAIKGRDDTFFAEMTQL